MLTDDELDDLYDELGIPYSDEELELHSKNRTLKSELEVEHAYNHEAIMIAKLWLNFINGHGNEPTICIWRIIRPGKNLSNDRCNRLKTIFDNFSTFDYGKCPRLPIVPYCSRSAATLLNLLDKIYASSRLDDATVHFKNLLSLISNRGKRKLSHEKFSAELHAEVDNFILSLEQYSHELGDYLRTFLKSQGGESPNRKLDTIITKLDKKAAKEDVAQIVRHEAAPIRKTLAKVDATTTTINNRDKKYRRKSKARFSVEQQDGIYRQWMIAKQDTAVRALCEHKPGYEAAIIQFRKEFSAWGVHTAEELKGALKARVNRRRYIH